MKDFFKRRGRFKITRDLIVNNPEGVMKVLNNVLICKLESDFINNILIYTGYSKYFDIIEPSESTPDYYCRVDINKNIEWKREK